MAGKKTDKQKEFDKMVKALGLSKREIAEMLGAPTRDKDGVLRHRKGGMVKKPAAKKMAKGGTVAAKKKMMKGGYAKKK